MAPIWKDTYSHCVYGNSEYDCERHEQPRRPCQDVQWSASQDPSPSEQRALSRDHSSREYCIFQSSLSLTRCYPAVEDTGEGRGNPHYMMRNNDEHRAKSQSVPSLALTPYVKGAVDTNSAEKGCLTRCLIYVPARTGERDTWLRNPFGAYWM